MNVNTTMQTMQYSIDRTRALCAKSIIDGSIPFAGVVQGFGSWTNRTHAVTGAEGSTLARP